MPRSLARLFNEGEIPDCDTLQIFHDQTSSPAQWNATATGNGVILPMNTGLGDLKVAYDITGLPTVPQTTLSFVNINSSGALNNSVIVPVAIRVMPKVELYAVVTNKIMNFSTFAKVEGDVHSNRDIVFATGTGGVINGNVTASRDVTIAISNTVDGDLTAGGIAQVDSGATVTGSVTQGASVGMVPIPPLGFGPFIGGDVHVPQGGDITIAPGTYDVVRCSSNAVIHFSSGIYNLNRLVMDTGSILKFNLSGGSVTINVDNRLLFRKNSQIEIESASGTSKDIFINYDGTNKLLFAKNSRTQGNIVAPNCRVKFAVNARFLGVICAKRVDIRSRVRIRHHDVPGGIPKTVASDNSVSDARSAANSYTLGTNYPNPFNPSTKLEFTLPEAGIVDLKIYDIMGRNVLTLAHGEFTSGRHEVLWNGHNQAGSVVAAENVYISLKP